MQTCWLVFILFVLTVTTTWAGELRCLRPGAPVISLYKENRYYPGRVEGLGDSIDVTFQNGQQQSYSAFTNDVIVDDIPDTSELTGGSRVLARRPRSTSFEPGFVNGSIEGLPLNDTFLVNFDTGDSIARNIEDIRLAVKPHSCMNEKGIYIGCFLNVVNNFLTNYYPVNPTDVATCNWACYTRGFRFAGLQNGTWCFCGNNVNDSLKVDDNDCNIACRDSREDVCGGYQRMTVYWTGADFSDNSTDDLSEFPDATGQVSPAQETLKSESSTQGECSDLHDSTECNTWAEQSKCIGNFDWMVANCKKSCYACDYDEHGADKNAKPDSSPQPAYTPQSQSSSYQSPAQPGYQASSSYAAQSSYATTSQDASRAQSSTTKADHAADNMSNTAGYLGCFRDSSTSHDLEYLADIRPLSIRACVTKCKSMRFPYAGVQSSTSCYCGLHYGKHGQLEHEDCNTPCEADSSEMCGGVSMNSLYHTGFPVKFKSTENDFTRKNSQSSSAYDKAYSTNPYASQYPQSSYPQPNYSPPSYPQPASPYSYTQAAATGYPQTSNTQTSGYPSTYPYNNQANNPGQSAGRSATNADTRDYSPADSSAYRWRETFVKLRAQEQERFSKPKPRALNRPWKMETSSPRVSGNVIGGDNHKKDESKDSSKVQNLGNSAKLLLKESPHAKNALPSKSKNYSPRKMLYKKLISQVYKNSRKSDSRGNEKIIGKGGKRRKPYEEPGVFLRKKASKKNSFLAFLPHEVTEDESLLENVYNMLSVMLKNLRKHRKNSMKNLKKYLKFSESREQLSKTITKAPMHASKRKESVHRSEKPTVQKFEGKEKAKSEELDSKHRNDGSSRIHVETAKPHHSSEGQKQLGKQRQITNSQRLDMQANTYTSHDVSHDASPDSSQSVTTNENSSHESYHHNPDQSKSTNFNQIPKSSTNIAQSHHNDVRNSDQSQVKEKVSENDPQQAKFSEPTGNISEVHRSKPVPVNEYQAKPKVSEGKVEDHRTLPKLQEKVSIDEKNLSSKSDSVLGREHNASSNNEKSLKTLPTETTDTLEKMPSPKTKSEGIDTVTTRDETNEDDLVEKSDDDIISTIVDLLRREKAMRKMDNESGQKDGKTKQLKKKEKRKKERKKRYNKKAKSKKTKNKKTQNNEKKNKKKTERKHKDRTKQFGQDKVKRNKTKRIYKKNHVVRAGDDDEDNLMKEEENFRENNGMNDK